jgi:hypothetical protein
VIWLHIQFEATDGEIVTMALMGIYVVLVIVGEVIAVMVGLSLDETFPTLSLPIALSLFFSVLAVMWPVAILIHDRVRPGTA